MKMRPYNPYTDDYEHFYHGEPPSNSEYCQMLYYLDLKKRLIKERE